MPSTVEPVVLPEGVGNPDLDRLREIVPPEAVAWTPQTAGWYVLAAAMAALLVWAVARLHRRWVANRFRRQALAELGEIERRLGEPGTREAALRALPGLVKRTALAVAPRRDVASLVGADLLSYLDRGLGGEEFSNGSGRALADLAYSTPERLAELTDQGTARLVALVRQWIRRGA